MDDKLYLVGKLEAVLKNYKTEEIVGRVDLAETNYRLEFYIEQSGHYILSIYINNEVMYKHLIGQFCQEGNSLSFDISHILRNIEHIPI